MKNRSTNKEDINIKPVLYCVHTKSDINSAMMPYNR